MQLNNVPTLFEINKLDNAEDVRSFETVRIIDIMIMFFTWIMQLNEVKRIEEVFFKAGGLNVVIGHTIICILMSMPLTQVGIILGVFSRRGYITMWNMVPLLKGVGWSMGITCLITEIYGMSLGALALLYVIDFSSWNIPWEGCDFPRATERCVRTIVPRYLNCCDIMKLPCLKENYENQLRYPAMEYLLEYRLQHEPMFEKVTGMGRLIPSLIFSVIFSWFVTYLIFSMKFPKNIYILTFIMTIVGGIMFIIMSLASVIHSYELPTLSLITVDYSNFFDIAFWINLSNTFFMCALPSYTVFLGRIAPQKFSAEALAINLTAFKFVCLISNVVALSTSVQVLAKNYKTHENCFNLNGVVILFALLPEYFLILPFGFMWTYLWFLCMWILSISSAVYSCVAFQKSLIDAIPWLFRFRFWIHILICVVLCSINVLIATNHLLFSLAAWRRYVLNIFPMLTIFSFCTVLLIYSFKRLFNDYSFTYDLPFPKYVAHNIYGVFTFSFFAVIIMLLDRSMSSINEYDSEFLKSLFQGYMFALMIPVIVYAVIVYLKHQNKNKAYLVFKPTDQWGPAHSQLKSLRAIYSLDGPVVVLKGNAMCKHNCLLESQKYKRRMEMSNQFNAVAVEQYYKGHLNDQNEENEGD